MFDLITGQATHTPRNQSLPILLSTAAHVVVVGLLVVLPLLYITDQLPEMPTMMAFVAAPPAPPPPPPPPLAAKKAPETPPPATPAAPGQLVAPVEAPPSVEPEPATNVGEGEDGVEGGVEGGVAGGVAGGIVGGLPDAPPPPPPPVPAEPRAPIRTGGKVGTPALVYRVEPKYPLMLAQAKVQGIVILEAIVGEDGTVTDLKVLRSVHQLLDREALAAVRQWRYEPLTLNGIPVRFVLTVTLSFTLTDPRG
jgi:protein TonB